MYDVVHIDEKWFYIKKIGQRVYLLTGNEDVPLENPPVQFVQSKRHIMKVMFLCAVARPHGDWDGKIGLWPVVERYIAQKTSVNSPAGVEELRPVSITRDILTVFQRCCDATSLANACASMLSIAASGILVAPKAKSSAP
ncbi:unnamed protein product [Phytophthora fragariaefolia]|uniref:Unnamed protein product n=1 Tax=Phytophthora fragariaefolia TaxID=1490495 RepID=A0A9W7CXC3_9STRA|nr:unnamed protein product [Phytophthora fragariaefolia]